MATVQIKINTVDKSSLIDWASFQKTEILTSQPDSCSFMIRNVPGKTYRPSLNDDVKVYRDGTLIFGGVVISTTETMNGLVKYFQVQCKDYTEILDGVLVAKAYASMTAAAIVQDIITNFAPAGFTTVNVVAPYNVNSISFNYISISQCLQTLAQSIPGFDWYVDYNKDIHFFMPAANTAPFTLDDASDNYIYGSLEFDADQSQIRNQIVVRGGTVVLPTVTNLQTSDGVRVIYYVGYNLASFAAFHAFAASPTSFLSLTVGRDGIDDPASFNCLYNPTLGLLRFVTAWAVGDVVKTTGIPSYPLISVVNDIVSQASYGIKEYVIVDKNITSKQQSIDRANAQLAQYSQPLYTGTFITNKDGLVEGQYLTINVPSRSISGSFKIQQIDTTLRTPSAVTSDLTYKVQFASALDVGIIELLNRLLILDQANQVDISQNEVPDRIYGQSETITIGEAIVISKVHHPSSETITLTEASNAAKNAGTIFVAGPYIPSNFADTKRVFVLNASGVG